MIKNIYLGVAVFLVNVVGQATQNICLPLALTDNPNMAVFLSYTALFYFFCFLALESVLDLFRTVPFPKPNSRILLVTSFQNMLNGMGVIFAGDAQRTPLTVQMAVGLLINCASPLYKVWVFKLPLSRLKPGLKWYAATTLLFAASLILFTVDRENHEAGGSSSAWMILFGAGIVFGMTYNVHQEDLIEPYHLKDHSTLDSFHLSVKILRLQTMWLFFFSWLSFPFSAIHGVTDPQLTIATFRASWGEFLTFSSTYMTVFNLSYFVTFFSSIFMNNFDSSFNMLTSNLSSVIILWAGWTPQFKESIGYFPSIPMTVVAMALGLVGCYTSFRLSQSIGNLKRHISPDKELLLPGQSDHESENEKALDSIHNSPSDHRHHKATVASSSSRATEANANGSGAATTTNGTNGTNGVHRYGSNGSTRLYAALGHAEP